MVEAAPFRSCHNAWRWAVLLKIHGPQDGRDKAIWKMGIQTSMAQGRSTKIMSTINWIRTSRFSIKNSLSLVVRGARGVEAVLVVPAPAFRNRTFENVLEQSTKQSSGHIRQSSGDKRQSSGHISHTSGCPEGKGG